MTRSIPIVGFLMLVVLLGMMLFDRPVVDDATNKPFPLITLKALDTKTVWNPDAMVGHVTVFNFFASWCTPCEAEMPELAAFKKQFPDVQLQGIAWNDDPQALTKWLKKNGNPFGAVWLDPNGDATIALGIKGVPETIVVDGAGIVRYRLTGPLTKELRDSTLDPLIQNLLTEASHAR